MGIFREFISKQQKKKVASENRRRKSISKASSADKAAPLRKTKTPEKKLIKRSSESLLNDIEAKEMTDKEKQEDDDLHQACIFSDLHYTFNGDSSEDSEEDIPRGLNEAFIKRMRSEGTLQKSFAGPEAWINRAQLLKNPRGGIFLYQCELCRERQKKREYYLFNTGISGLSLLTIELCAEDLDKNISLGMHYSGYFGHSNNGHQSGKNINSMPDLGNLFFTYEYFY
uniref:Uncharacterized protein n=1 Tax=Meloidogyne enterolobii TaxID=390850 RepID=A0A6V7XXR5_MELEN|nr:unnamed protein product [Meloidogyne enterolobii]